MMFYVIHPVFLGSTFRMATNLILEAVQGYGARNQIFPPKGEICAFGDNL